LVGFHRASRDLEERAGGVRQLRFAPVDQPDLPGRPQFGHVNLDQLAA
jgi:hypothetical protein